MVFHWKIKRSPSRYVKFHIPTRIFNATARIPEAQAVLASPKKAESAKGNKNRKIKKPVLMQTTLNTALTTAIPAREIVFFINKPEHCPSGFSTIHDLLFELVPKCLILE